jgi:hypothetical protein
MPLDPRPTDETTEDQGDYDEIILIDEQGTVYKLDEAQSQYIKKPTILRDPEGEY